MSERYVVKRLEDVGSFVDAERSRWHPIRTELGINAFGVNAWRATEAGQELIGEHDELGDDSTGHEELYVVLSGHATFTVDGETVDAPAGKLVFVGPEVKRAATAEEAGTTILVAGGERGGPFSISPWERSAKGLEFFATKEYDRALEYFEQAHREAPAQAAVLYNLACAESMVGRTDDALGHLEQAIELSSDFREAAQTDTDFDAIRADPRFPAAGG
ncbi:MAG: tetratricopeptide repeat protein [Actinobacteria bacterium]|nr:tetratricopeptide repeat protein [Actinomycetota bacterium]